MEMKTTTETARQRLRRQDCALVVIDIQEKLLPPIHERERLVRNAQLLLRLAQILDLPIVATTQYARGLGGVVREIASLLPAQAASDKLEFSCFNDQTFCGAVKDCAKNRNTLSGQEPAATRGRSHRAEYPDGCLATRRRIVCASLRFS